MRLDTMMGLGQMEWVANHIPFLKNLASCWWAGRTRCHATGSDTTITNSAVTSIGSVMWQAIGNHSVVQPWPWGKVAQVHA